MTTGLVAMPGRRRIGAEILIVLGLSLGASAAYAVVSIINQVTKDESIANQTASLNRSLNEREIFDLIYQLMAIFFDLVPVALVIFLLWSASRPHLGRLGIDFTKPAVDAGWGVVLALVVGIPGLAIYFIGRAAGASVNVTVNPEDAYWWTAIVLLLSAVRAAVTEEVIVIGYLFARLKDLGWGKWTILFSTAALRGTYHLYQGVPAFIGNFAMGVLFGWLYQRLGRLLPLVIAHFVIDAAIFIGYPWALATFPDLFRLPEPAPTPTPSN